jgi:hypothetical protein
MSPEKIADKRMDVITTILRAIKPLAGKYRNNETARLIRSLSHSKGLNYRNVAEVMRFNMDKKQFISTQGY